MSSNTGPRLTEETEGGKFYDNAFGYRNDHVLTTLVVQMFLMFSGGVIVVGVIYVTFLVIAIFCHHICFDRDPYRVPDFIKRSPQFEDDEEADPDTLRAEFEKQQEQAKTRFKSIARPNVRASESTDDENYGHIRGPTAAKKAELLDKFARETQEIRGGITGN